MKRIIFLVIATLTFAGVLQEIAAASECPAFNINLLGVRKELPSDWKPNAELDTLGFNVDFTGKEWPVSLDLGYLSGFSKGTAQDILINGNVFSSAEAEAITTEVFAGVKKIWTSQDFRYFLAAGPSWITGRVSFSNVTATENSLNDAKVGWYASAGIYYSLFKFLNLGIIGRYSDTQLNLARGGTIQAGGWQYGFLAGISF